MTYTGTSFAMTIWWPRRRQCAVLLGAALLSFFFVGCGEHASSASSQAAGQPVVSQELLNVRDQAAINEAETLRSKERYPEAVAAYEKLIKERPEFAEAYFRLGALYFHLGLKTKSEEFYLKALDHDFKNPEIYFHLGYIKESDGKLQDALEWYLKAEEKGVGSAELYFNIGNVFASLDNKERAVEYYKKAVTINPNHMDAFVNLSVMSYHLGQYVDARQFLDKAKTLGYGVPAGYEETLEKAMASSKPSK